jgi:acetylornithine deacetylase/succinyl-diaminopimelate desuccinylase-like protein
VLIEGAEESGPDDVSDWVLADERGADCAIVFDSAMVDPETPAITLATRGMVFAHLEVRTGERNAHSGQYGGAALNAFHALNRSLAAVLPGPDGRLPSALRAGIEPPTADELESWKTLPHGASELADAGARPADERAADEFWERIGADTSLDVHKISGGEVRTIVPPVAGCDLSLRLAPGQDADAIAAALERLLRDALPPGAELAFGAATTPPWRSDPAAEPIQIAQRAIARACGREAALVRTGGTIPVLAAFMQRDIPVILSGFDLAQDNIHAPDESFAIASLELGRRSARALYEDLAALR